MQKETDNGPEKQTTTSTTTLNRTPQDKSNQRRINEDLDELLFESIQIDGSTVNPARDEAFAKVLVELPNVNHPKPMLKMKVDTGAQGNILPLRIYRNMFPEHIDDYGLPTGTTPPPTKLTAYNGTPIRQHGVCSIKCSYGDKETNAMFYVAGVNGPAICGLTTPVSFS